MAAILSNKKWQPGTYNYGPVAIPLGVEYVKLTVDVTDMLDPANRVTFDAEVSQDGGGVWRRERAVFAGGPIAAINPDGSPLTRSPPYISYHEFHVPNPQNQSRMARVALIIEGAAVKLGSTIETR
jgi:hypothetical protein